MLVIVIIIGVILTGISIYSLIGTRMRMLEGVTETIMGIGNGNYDAVIPNKYLEAGSEVGQLAKAVEVMKNKQRDSIIEIKHYSENLESLVESRTAELEDINQEMELSLEELKNTQNQLVESKKD